VKIVLADVHGPVCGKDQPSANLSLLYLASWARKVLTGLQFTYIPQRVSREDHLRQVVDLNPDVYAISFTSFSARVACSLVDEVRRLQPDCLIVVGGAHANSHAQQLLERTAADLCVIGEGEETFAEVLASLDDIKARRASIDGLAYLQDGAFVRTTPRSMIADIDSIPFPARDLVRQEDFTGISYSVAQPNTEVVTTRGCPLRCTFCANPVFRDRTGPPFRSRSPEQICREVDQLYAAGYREIYFHSDEINVDGQWMLDLCEALTRLGHADMHFQTNLRAVPMNEELAGALARAGFWLVRMGIESANPRVLKGIRKMVALSDIENACRTLADSGLVVFAFLMMFNVWEEDGELCYETPDEVRNTLRFVDGLRSDRVLHLTSWQVATPTPGAEMYDIASRHGLITPDYLPDEPWFPYEHLDGVSRLDYKLLLARARWQTAGCALSEGVVEWKNWRRIVSKSKAMIGM